MQSIFENIQLISNESFQLISFDQSIEFSDLNSFSVKASARRVKFNQLIAMPLNGFMENLFSPTITLSASDDIS